MKMASADTATAAVHDRATAMSVSRLAYLGSDLYRPVARKVMPAMTITTGVVFSIVGR
jgi:hypothetical protein